MALGGHRNKKCMKFVFRVFSRNMLQRTYRVAAPNRRLDVHWFNSCCHSLTHNWLTQVNKSLTGKTAVWKRLQIGTDMLLIITSTGDRLFRFINIDGFKRPWSPKWIFFRNFWMQRTFQHWIATKWLEIDQDNLHMKFSPLNVDFSSLSFDP